MQKALESLFTKSSEAVHHYLVTDGFSKPPDVKKTKFDSDDDSASAVSGQSESSTAAFSECDSSDDELSKHAASSPDKENHAAHGDDLSKLPSCRKFTIKNRKSAISADTGYPAARDHRCSSKRDLDEDESDEEIDAVHQHHLPPRYPPGHPGRTVNGPISRASPPGCRAPPPPPGWQGPPPVHTSMRGGPPMMPPAPSIAARVPMPPPPAANHSLQQQHFLYGQRMPMAGPLHGSSPHHAHQLHHPSGAPPQHPSSLHPAVLSGPTQSSSSSGDDARASIGLFDVRLTILWLGRGEQRVLEQVRPSISALKDAALTYVRTHGSAFEPHHHQSSLSSSPPSVGVGGGVAAATGGGKASAPSTIHLRAVVRQALFGRELYDMTTYRGDDLTKLFAVMSNDSIPSFEIAVDSPVRPASSFTAAAAGVGAGMAAPQ
ncbi:hypothetical protein DL766_004516 [Monosporascus sp. MC13-8B]|uniref:Uncharacterized protein n=1 Tax=Monosporascus cannonballus TaxID=155416 RepID=A0ABY0H4R0_9PEZI|nr:hypothetical protein DL763_011347 [Monosporascus cannonballus]RYO84530.1 hypothetical protein DL762_005636 [Monosporascus cannonballus]RYP31208.1 hypothetical protein DL766_004516 [Monosporascus sp. MC13-8B]